MDIQLERLDYFEAWKRAPEAAYMDLRLRQKYSCRKIRSTYQLNNLISPYNLQSEI